MSCFDDISWSTEIVQAEKGLETTKTIGVDISGTSKIVGKDSNRLIEDLYSLASTLALKYVDTEVPQNCNKQEIVLACTTDYPFIFKASGRRI